METINVCENGHHVLTHTNFTLLPRTLAIHNAQIELRENPQDHIYNFKPNSFFTDKHQNLVVIPAFHILSKQTATIFLFITANLSMESL